MQTPDDKLQQKCVRQNIYIHTYNKKNEKKIAK